MEGRFCGIRINYELAISLAASEESRMVGYNKKYIYSYLMTHATAAILGGVLYSLAYPRPHGEGLIQIERQSCPPTSAAEKTGAVSAKEMIRKMEARRKHYVEEREQLWKKNRAEQWPSSMGPEATLKSSLAIQGIMPIMSCNSQPRFGSLEDGGKTLCNVEQLLGGPDCIVYSIGVAKTCEFEWDLQAEMPNCRIDLFDANRESMEWFKKSRCANSSMRFHNWAVGGGSNVSKPAFGHPAYSFQEIMEKLGHQGRVINVLKMDIEGYEYDLFEAAKKAENFPVINLILVEFHNIHRPAEQERLKNVVRWLEDAGYSPYFLERNPYWAYTGAEVAFVRRQAIYDLL